MKRPSKFKSANYPVASRRHLLEAGTEWVSFLGHAVTLIGVHEHGQITFARPHKDPARLPYAARISERSFLRNYRRRDEA
jgi:hypothetical protein